jgi:hypothetical protein
LAAPRSPLNPMEARNPLNPQGRKMFVLIWGATRLSSRLRVRVYGLLRLALPSHPQFIERKDEGLRYGNHAPSPESGFRPHTFTRVRFPTTHLHQSQVSGHTPSPESGSRPHTFTRVRFPTTHLHQSQVPDHAPSPESGFQSCR